MSEFERLTWRTTVGTPNFDMADNIRKDNIARSAFYQKVCDRLAAYEDTGLTPEQIKALTADKDEQAGRLMQYDSALRQARKALKICGEVASSEKNQLFWTADVAHKAIKAIDALLGGKEDA